MGGVTDATVAHADSSSSARAERMRGIVVIVIAFLGMILSMPTVIGYSIGVFMLSLESSEGWDRANVSLAMTFFSIVMFLMSALAGRLADAVGAARAGGASMLAFGLALVIGSRLVDSVEGLWLFYAVAAVAGIATTPVVLLRPVAANFSARRGIAMGVVLCGVGLGAALVPQFATFVVSREGWRDGYAAFGVAAIVFAPVLWLALREGAAEQAAKNTIGEVASTGGPSLKTAFKEGRFWLLSTISLMGMLGLSGFVSHLIPLARDQGMGAAEAAGVASVLGISSIVGRIGTGLALDRVPGKFVGIAVFSIGATGMLLLASKQVDPLFAAMMIGLTLGAEVDLLAYLVSRYYGLRAFAAIFGWNYGMLSIGALASPIMFALLQQSAGTYSGALFAAATALSFAAFGCLFLGQYARQEE
ncbi:MAG: MFS transporter [Sphingomonadales bacterium]|nr:MAG: MFS transporter [Sphingomonadales bacterium]